MSKRYRVVRPVGHLYWQYAKNNKRAAGPGPRAIVHRCEDGAEWFERRISHEKAAELFGEKGSPDRAAEKAVKEVPVEKPKPKEDEFVATGFIPEVWQLIMDHKDFDPDAIGAAYGKAWLPNAKATRADISGFPRCCGASTYTDFYGLGLPIVTGKHN